MRRSGVRFPPVAFIKMPKRLKKRLLIIFAIILTIILSLYIVRKVSPTELDDLHPAIPCEDKLIKESDILWIIPIFENISINDYKEWCQNILALNKTLGLHGVYHAYKEFNNEVNENYLEKGIEQFKDCFGYKPEIFKSPQLSISKENKNLVKNKNLILKGKFNQLFHKVYHCSDTGLFPNNFIYYF